MTEKKKISQKSDLSEIEILIDGKPYWLELDCWGSFEMENLIIKKAFTLIC
jgi:hypothetical protein